MIENWKKRKHKKIYSIRSPIVWWTDRFSELTRAMWKLLRRSYDRFSYVDLWRCVIDFNKCCVIRFVFLRHISPHTKLCTIVWACCLFKSFSNALTKVAETIYPSKWFIPIKWHKLKRSPYIGPNQRPDLFVFSGTLYKNVYVAWQR